MAMDNRCGASDSVQIEGFHAMLRKWQLVLVILVLASISVPTARNSGLVTSDAGNMVTIQDQQNPSYVPHSPIIINSNADFETQGWLGNGTQTDPYVIEGLSIITDGKECINVSHTDVFFVVRNCFISSVSQWEGLWNRGITLGDVTNGMVERVVVSKKWLAVTIVSSSDCSVIECEIYDSGLAIDVQGPYGEGYPEHCTIFNNTVYDSREGVHLYHVRQCLVDRNDILGDICLQETVECTVSNNRIDGSQAGFWSYYLSFFEAVDTLVANNTMINSGLELDYTPIPSLQVYNNTVNDKPIGYFANLSDATICPSNYGQVILVDCNNVTVQDGVIHDTADGVDFLSCRDCILKNCTIYSCGHGTTLCWSEGCSVILSKFHHNRQWGIAVVESDNALVAANIVYQNQGIGIFVPPIGGFGNRYFHNVICANGEGYTISAGNSWDGGQQSVWDDGKSQGNYWDDYGGAGEYYIPGDAGSIDRYPSRVSPVGESGFWIGFSITPSRPTENDTVSVTMGVIDIDGVKDVILSYSIDGNLTWANLSMTHYGPIWTTSIPPQDEGTTISYQAIVRDEIGNLELSEIQSYAVLRPNVTDVTNVTDAQIDENMLMTLAIAIGGTLVVAGLALILSRRRY
ncbi:MAG: hypothetical protein C4K48_11005 [Candidatus Thorarchaeota archaeon]|nr:MAG: hypothetical protein C4K48_11005 [Candidatus Thorarchaeota archaeon]